MSAVILFGLIQMPYYGMLPVPIHLLMLATAISWREPSMESESGRERVAAIAAVNHRVERGND
jgi:hypothetical protein